MESRLGRTFFKSRPFHKHQRRKRSANLRQNETRRIDGPYSGKRIRKCPRNRHRRIGETG
jgi:hypothetical protein